MGEVLLSCLNLRRQVKSTPYGNPIDDPYNHGTTPLMIYVIKRWWIKIYYPNNSHHSSASLICLVMENHSFSKHFTCGGDVLEMLESITQYFRILKLWWKMKIERLDFKQPPETVTLDVLGVLYPLLEKSCTWFDLQFPWFSY